MYYLIALEQLYVGRRISPVDYLQSAAVCTEPLRDQLGAVILEGVLIMDDGYELHALGQFNHLFNATGALDRLFTGVSTTAFRPDVMVGLDPKHIIATRTAVPLIKLTEIQTEQYLMRSLDEETLAEQHEWKLVNFENSLHAVAECDGFELDEPTVHEVLTRFHRDAVANGTPWTRVMSLVKRSHDDAR